MSFRFQQFTVEDSHSSLRIGTDAMLLGSWANPRNAKTILDIGTGCGVLALMMAQNADASIDAIEIDEPSVVEAQLNFSQSPWPDRLKAIHSSLQEFSNHTSHKYDFIISNPPYFSHALKSPLARKNQARHDEKLSLTELVQHTSRLLADHGLFSVILPADQKLNFMQVCYNTGLFISRSMMVHPKPNTFPKRVLMEFSKIKGDGHIESALTIQDDQGKFTAEYLALTGCFHQF